MSILNPLVLALFDAGNQVIADVSQENASTHSQFRRPEPRTVVAVLLALVDGRPYQLAFLEGEKCPFRFTGRTLPWGGRHREEVLSEVVPLTHETLYFRGISAGSTVDDIFASICGGGPIQVLEFSAVKEIIPFFYDRHELEDRFDGVSVLVAEGGVLLTPKLLLCLQQERNHNNPREKAPHRPFGNVLIWTTSGSLHWVTRRTGEQHAVSLQVVAQGITEYSDLVALVNEYHKDRWVVVSGTKMPYHIQKVEPVKEPTQAELDKELIAAADKVRRASVSSTANPAVLVSLLSLTHDMINSPIPNVQSVLRGKVENAINEYFVILDGVGGKKRGEIKEGILNALLKADTQ